MSHVAGGGQALVLWFEEERPVFPGKVGKARLRPGFYFARLYDEDPDRLQKTARELGIGLAELSYGGETVKRVVSMRGGEVEIEGWGYACVKVWGRPLARALKMCRGGVLDGWETGAVC
jgi:hypothetical protein